MKSKNLILSAMLMALPSTLMAQQNIQKAFDALLKDKIVETKTQHTLERDPETGQKTAQADVYDFTLPTLYARKHIKEIQEAFEKEVQRCLAKEEECIRAGKTVCCYTTRALITADTGDKEDELRLSVRISDAVQSLVGRLTVTPAFVIAKGGITSSDVGTKALAVKRANVLGQIRPGIPVWQTGEESKFPQTPYVIFPGNVGENTTLREAVEVLTAR